MRTFERSGCSRSTAGATSTTWSSKRAWIRQRKKGPSRPYRQDLGHTPLSADEAIPWSAPRLIIGTGASGQLPIMAGVYVEAERRGVEVIAEPTASACDRLRDLDPASYSAILHVTC